MYSNEHDYDAMHYDLEITFNVRIAKWRIDDPRDKDNIEWSLSVYDRNLQEWVNINELNRPGEYGMLDELTIISDKPVVVPYVDRSERPPLGAQRTRLEGINNG